jgi:hypothetical protein
VDLRPDNRLMDAPQTEREKSQNITRRPRVRDPIAQREAIVEPDPMADDLAGETVVFVAFGGSGWRHVGCLF